MKLKEFIKDDQVTNQNMIVLVSNMSVAQMKTGKSYGKYEIEDKTAKLPNVNCFEDNSTEFKAGDLVSIYLVKGEYNGAVSYQIKGIQPAPQIGLEELNPEDFTYGFTPKMKYLEAEFDKYYKQLSNSYKLIVDRLFDLEDPDKSRYFSWPAAITMHHNVKHGLLYHTTGVLKMADAMIPVIEEHYEMKVNKQLVYLAIILHDFFKLKEYDMAENGKGLGTKYSMLGHIVMANQFLGYLRYNNEISEEMNLELSHILAAHHGELEYGSPVKPMTLEAYIVSRADDTDAKLYMIKDMYETLVPGEISAQKSFGLGNVFVYKPLEELK